MIYLLVYILNKKILIKFYLNKFQQKIFIIKINLYFRQYGIKFIKKDKNE